MSKIIHKININVDTGVCKVDPPIDIYQGDKGSHVLLMQLFDNNGNFVEINPGVINSIAFYCNGRLIESSGVKVENAYRGLLSYTMSRVIVNEIGRYTVYLSRKVDGDEISSFSFVVTISKSHKYNPKCNEVILSRAEYDELMKLVDENPAVMAHLKNLVVHVTQEDHDVIDYYAINQTAIDEMLKTDYTVTTETIDGEKVTKKISVWIQQLLDSDDILNRNIQVLSDDVHNRLDDHDQKLQDHNDRLDTQYQMIVNNESAISNLNNKVDNEVNALNQSINSVDSKVDNVDDKVDQSVAEINQSITELNEEVHQVIDTKIADINTQLNSLSDDVSSVQDSVSELSSDLDNKLDKVVVIEGKEYDVIELILSIATHHTHNINDIYEALTIGGPWSGNLSDITSDLQSAVDANEDIQRLMNEGTSQQQEALSSIYNFSGEMGILTNKSLVQFSKPKMMIPHDAPPPEPDESEEDYMKRVAYCIFAVTLVDNTLLKPKMDPTNEMSGYDINNFGTVAGISLDMSTGTPTKILNFHQSDKLAKFDFVGYTESLEYVPVAYDDIADSDGNLKLDSLELKMFTNNLEDEDLQLIYDKYKDKRLVLSSNMYLGEDPVPTSTYDELYDFDSPYGQFAAQANTTALVNIMPAAPLFDPAMEGSGALKLIALSLDSINDDVIEIKTPAKELINNAYSLADDAYSLANNAYSRADNAYSRADNAYSRADNAYSLANNAYSLANNAYSRADNAYSLADDAYSLANNAYSLADDAYSLGLQYLTNVTNSRGESVLVPSLDHDWYNNMQGGPKFTDSSYKYIDHNYREWVLGNVFDAHYDSETHEVTYTYLGHSTELSELSNSYDFYDFSNGGSYRSSEPINEVKLDSVNYDLLPKWDENEGRFTYSFLNDPSFLDFLEVGQYFINSIVSTDGTFSERIGIYEVANINNTDPRELGVWRLYPSSIVYNSLAYKADTAYKASLKTYGGGAQSALAVLYDYSSSSSSSSRSSIYLSYREIINLLLGDLYSKENFNWTLGNVFDAHYDDSTGEVTYTYLGKSTEIVLGSGSSQGYGPSYRFGGYYSWDDNGISKNYSYNEMFGYENDVISFLPTTDTHDLDQEGIQTFIENNMKSSYPDHGFNIYVGTVVSTDNTFSSVGYFCINTWDDSVISDGESISWNDQLVVEQLIDRNTQSTAQSAETKATNAQSTAQSAETKATNAQSTAQSAETKATNAQSTAQSAETKAYNVQYSVNAILFHTYYTQQIGQPIRIPVRETQGGSKSYSNSQDTGVVGSYSPDILLNGKSYSVGGSINRSLLSSNNYTKYSCNYLNRTDGYIYGVKLSSYLDDPGAYIVSKPTSENELKVTMHNRIYYDNSGLISWDSSDTLTDLLYYDPQSIQDLRDFINTTDPASYNTGDNYPGVYTVYYAKVSSTSSEWFTNVVIYLKGSDPQLLSKLEYRSSVLATDSRPSATTRRYDRYLQRTSIDRKAIYNYDPTSGLYVLKYLSD